MSALEWCKAGLVDFLSLDGLGGPPTSEVRGPAVSSLVLAQCVRQDWDNWFHPKGNHGLAHGRPRTVQSGFG